MLSEQEKDRLLFVRYQVFGSGELADDNRASGYRLSIQWHLVPYEDKIGLRSEHTVSLERIS